MNSKGAVRVVGIETHSGETNLTEMLMLKKTWRKKARIWEDLWLYGKSRIIKMCLSSKLERLFWRA